jgi:general secretion pathway protein C
VVLDNRGRREELFSFEKSDSTGAPPSVPPARQSAVPRRPPFALESPARDALPNPPQEQEDEHDAAESGMERVSENVWRINRDDLAEQLDNFGQMMREARLTPHFSGGQADGFMITNLPSSSFLGRMGLRNGDIMKGVNGQKFGSLEEFFQAYQQLQSESVLQLEVERGNRTETLTYEIR